MLTLDSRSPLRVPKQSPTQTGMVATFVVAQYVQYKLEATYGTDVCDSTDANHIRRLMTNCLQFVLKNSVLLTEFVTVFDDLTTNDGTLSVDAIGDLDCLGDLVRFADAQVLTYRTKAFQ